MRLAFTLFTIVLVLAVYSCQSPEKKIQIIHEDAAWCWFSDPRALGLKNTATIVGGGVSEEGSVVAFSYDAASNKFNHGVIHSALEKDDHNNPAFLELPDGKILAFYTRHHNKELFIAKSMLAGEVSQWEKPEQIEISNPEEEKAYGAPRYTYANPFMLSSENNRIFLFGRWMGFKPTMIWSDDQGKTWSNSHVVISPKPFDEGNRPYVKYYSDGNKRIHITFTDGHPRLEESNSVYYAYYEDDTFYRADGTVICSVDNLPLEPSEASLVYRGNPEKGRAWVYDIKADENGYPVIAYARYPSEQEHIYCYARFSDQNWENFELCNSGKWFPQTPEDGFEREPHYSGGLAIDGNDISTVYLSREIDGTFEIEKWHLKYGTNKWISEAVTLESDLDQVRPVVPWWTSNMSPVVLWMENEKYVHYTDYKTHVKGLIIY